MTSPGRRTDRLFNPFELRLFRSTAVLLCLVALTALIGIILWTLGWVLSEFYHLLLSLAVAGILALVLYPVVDFLHHKLHFPRVVAIIVLMLAFFAGIGGMIFLVVPVLVSQIVQLMTDVPENLANWVDNFSYYYPEVSAMISERMANSGGEESRPALQSAGTTLVSYLSILAGLSFVPLFLFFALLSGTLLQGKAAEVLSVFQHHTQQKVMYFMTVFLGYVTAFFRGQLIIALCMGILYAVSFTLIGLQFGLLAGLVLGLLNIIPFLGTLIGLMVILPLAWLQEDGGGAQLMALAFVAFALVQLVESWLLTPKIMANHTGLHPALVVISLFFWGTILSPIIGMVLAVPLTAFFVAIWHETKASLRHALSNQELDR